MLTGICAGGLAGRTAQDWIWMGVLDFYHHYPADWAYFTLLFEKLPDGEKRSRMWSTSNGMERKEKQVFSI